MTVKLIGKFEFIAKIMLPKSYQKTYLGTIIIIIEETPNSIKKYLYYLDFIIKMSFYLYNLYSVQSGIICNFIDYDIMRRGIQ